jgi:hypothetical protein
MLGVEAPEGNFLNLCVQQGRGSLDAVTILLPQTDDFAAVCLRFRDDPISLVSMAISTAGPGMAKEAQQHVHRPSTPDVVLPAPIT